jgi:uncharacterized protein (TIGR04255 family)
MANREVFPTPLAKQVILELRFPNLFFIEGRIGEFQIGIMKDFPQAALVHRRNFMVLAGNLDSPEMQEAAKQQQRQSDIEKIWQFKSESGTRVEVSSRTMSLVTEMHTSYTEGGEKSFRAVAQKVLAQFLSLTSLPLFLRVGLRYINECPLFNRTTDTFRDCYNSILPVQKFGLENLSVANCIAVARRGNGQIQHAESLRFAQPPVAGHGQIVIAQPLVSYALILDLDASCENVAAERVLTTADELHEMIAAEFREVIKEPILDFMRKEGANQ